MLAIPLARLVGIDSFSDSSAIVTYRLKIRLGIQRKRRAR